MYRSRSTLRRATTAAAVAAVTAGLITAGPAAFADPPGPVRGNGPAGQDQGVLTLDGVDPGPKTITLITGDTVTLTGTGTGPGAYAVDVDPAPRPDGHIPLFEGTFDEDAFYLYPDDARPAVLSGVLDENLFNLTYLAENGYTDADADSVPVIAQYPTNQPMRALAASADALPASEPGLELSSIHASGLTVSKDDAGAFWSAIAPTMAGSGVRPSALPTGISKLWLDYTMHVSLDESVPMIGAPEAWDLGLDGTGVTVGIIDTGIDENHPDLAGKVIDSQSFVPGSTAHDGHGHGTHVASTIVGSGAASDGQYKGVAPGAKLLVGKALSDFGNGASTWVIAAMEWAANNGADIISMSLGSRDVLHDPSTQAVNELTASTGALFVVAAGNDGPGAHTVGAPGIADSALTVAAVDKSDQLADFSSRGPLVHGGLKPDIAAPGVAITAARSAGTDMHGGAAVVDEYYDTASGTSMATPHVSGAAAILAQAHPDWTPAELKTALMSTSVDDGYSAYEQGAGRVDIARAIDQTVFATTPNADFGIVPNDAEPLSRQIAYRNTGDQDVTLTLTPSLRLANGDSAPDGTLTVDDRVTVPAGGTANVTVTLTPTSLVEGVYSGAVVATDETTGTRLRTPVGFQRQPPLETLTVKILGRDGQLTMPDNGIVRAIDVTNELGDFAIFGSWVSTGVFEVPVPEGTTAVSAHLTWVDESRRKNYGFLLDPQVEVSGDTEVTLDARDLNKFTFHTSRPAEVPASGDIVEMGWQRTLARGWRTGSYVDAANFYQFWLPPTEPLDVGDLQVFASMPLAAPEVTLRVKGAPDLALHPTSWPHEGTTFNGGYTGELFAGTQTLDVVDVGVGRPEDLAGLDLTGKLALLDDDRTCALRTDRIHNVRDAGAAGILAWPSGEIGVCFGGPFIPLGPTTTIVDGDKDLGIPYVSIAPGEALALRDRLGHGAVQVTVTGTPVSPYVYEATPFELGQVPDSLTYDLTDRHVARVDTEYHATEPTEFRPETYSHTANGMLAAIVFPPVVTGPDTGTHYVGPLSDQVIHLRKVIVNGGELKKVDLFDHPVRTRDVWNGAAAVPGSGTFSDAVANMNEPDTPQLAHWNFALCAMCREGDEFYPVFHRDFGGREFSAQYIAPGLTHLYRGSQEIPLDTEKSIPSFTMPAEPGDYRMTLQDPGTRTASEWTFHSDGTAAEYDSANGMFCPSAHVVASPTCRPEPLVYATYDLGDWLGMDNTVRAGNVHLFTVNAYHAPSRADMPGISGLRLWYSVDDGDHWIPALTVPKGNGSYSALAIYPPYGLTSGAVSLKVQAWDRDGNTLTQTTTRAFELRPWHTHHTGPTAQ